MVDTQKLLSKIKDEGKSQKSISELLGISQCSVSLKINNKRPFFVTEACQLAEFLNISDADFGSYFFTHEVA